MLITQRLRVAALPLAVFMLLGVSNLSAGPLVGLVSGNRLVQFDSSNPGSILTNVIVTGLAPGHNLVGIDYRPADQVLVGVARDPGTGQAQV